MSEYSDKLRYLGLWGAGKMIGAPFDEQELMAWAHKQIQSMQVDVDALTAEVSKYKRLASTGAEQVAKLEDENKKLKQFLTDRWGDYDGTWIGDEILKLTASTEQ